MDQETHQLLEEFDRVVAERTDKERRFNELIREMATYHGDRESVKHSIRVVIEQYREEIADDEEFMVALRKDMEEMD